MSSSVARTSKYTYRSSGAAAGNVADVSIEYSADLSALSRLEVIYFYHQSMHSVHLKEDYVIYGIRIFSKDFWR